MSLFPLFSIKSISLNTQGIIDWMRKTECSHSVTGKYGENCVVTKLSPVYFPFACVSLASRCKLGLEVLSTVIITAVNSMCGLVSEHRKHPCSEPGPLFPDSELVLFHHSTNKVSQLFHTWLQWHSSCFCSHQAKFNLLTYCIFWTTYISLYLFVWRNCTCRLREQYWKCICITSYSRDDTVSLTAQRLDQGPAMNLPLGRSKQFLLSVTMRVNSDS